VYLLDFGQQAMQNHLFGLGTAGNRVLPRVLIQKSFDVILSKTNQRPHVKWITVGRCQSQEANLHGIAVMREKERERENHHQERNKRKGSIQAYYGGGNGQTLATKQL
jgi:ribosomal protein L34E